MLSNTFRPSACLGLISLFTDGAADTVGSAALAVLALAAVVVVLPDIYDANEMISVTKEQSVTAGCTETRLQIPLPVVLYGQNAKALYSNWTKLKSVPRNKPVPEDFEI